MKHSLYGGLFFLLALTAISMVWFFIFQHKLYTYLRENHTEKWKELTTVLGFGPGYTNSLRAIKFLFRKDDLDDPELLRLKVIVRNASIYVLTGFLAVFIWWCVIVAVYPQQ